MSEISFKLLTPTVPNFIMIDTGTAFKRQDGFAECPKVSVGELSDKQLDSVASDWKKALFENAQRQRMLKGQP